MLSLPEFDLDDIRDVEQNSAIRVVRSVMQGVNLINKHLNGLDAKVLTKFKDKQKLIYDGVIDCIEYQVNRAEIIDDVTGESLQGQLTETNKQHIYRSEKHHELHFL
ncbi:hypothetical protein GCM10011607_12500 [Shewanella inventionis]|uniref:Uncharacterized protein n=1 Tax=Shewanella inventionis TaxID=1738770 RepID=A0ABQ1IYH5_9GAMM|nr:hypothetical protein [Shewanella inventionis]GGB53443.1 hypothetical protein GCM10011607_12500 [Shewanella inventionis]